MQIEKVKLVDLKPYHMNCKKHNEKNISSIKYSINKFNQYKPLIISKRTNQIIVGNGTYQALKQLNYEYADVVYLDLDEQQQKILNISDNKTSDLSQWNDKLLQLINNFSSEIKDILDFDKDFLKKFEKIQKLQEKKVDISEQSVILSENENKILVSKPNFIKCPCCGKEFQL